MELRKTTATLLVLLLSIGSIYAQDCTGYHQYHCIYADYTFFYSRQSKSALFQQGQTSELNMVAYGGEDYYIGVCAHRKFGDIRYRILEDNESRTVIYDNASDEFASSVTFSNESTRNLIIEVSVPEGKGNDRRCVGVIIQFRKNDPEGES
ncbi:MAG TPA: hypothetical protein DDX98_10650 [Bacteroidales bacterium]|jgi:hypothetical protein|nr:hypothetical protein [Bacteroidales bacterium]